MNNKYNTTRLLLRKEHIRTLALENLSIIFGGDQTTRSKETQLISKHPTSPILVDVVPTGCD